MPRKINAALEANKFKPGQSGNPAGRAKGSINLKTRIKKWSMVMDKVKLPNGKEQNVQIIDAMILGLMKKARDGDPYAFDVLMNRLEGKVSDRVVMAGDPDAPIKHEVESEIDYSALDKETLEKIAAARKTK